MTKRLSVGKEDRWTEAEARRRLEEWRASGQKLAEYARGSGESRDRLEWWKRKLGITAPVGGVAVHASPKASVAATIPTVENTATPPSYGFVEVRQMTPGPERSVLAEPERKSVKPGLELRIRGGYCLRIPAGFDGPTLKQVLDVLGEVG